MMGSDSSLKENEAQHRSQRFTALRAAQRILIHSAHLPELEATFEQGREVVVALHELNDRLGPAQGDLSEAGALFSRVDGLLDAMSQRTRTLLDRTSIPQLRREIAPLAEERPEEIRGFIDAILEWDIENGENLRLIEFLVTELCSRERDSRRAVVQSPVEAVPHLEDFARKRLDTSNDQRLLAKKTFSTAAQHLFGNEELGPIRDRLRAFKEELGSGLLHPDVLAAAVQYNVAIRNRISGMMEGSRLLDRLADDLLAPTAQPSAVAADSIFGSCEFEELVEAVAARVKGESLGSGRAERAASLLELGGLTPIEIEAFEGTDQDANARITRAAITLHLADRSPAAEAALQMLGLEPELFKGAWREELMREITGAAQKLLVDGDFTLACRLSEVRAKNLGTTPSRRRTDPAAALASQVAAPAASSSVQSFVKLAALVFALAWFAGLAVLFTSDGAAEAVPQQQLAEISSYLDSGLRSRENGVERFVGTLNTGWDRLGGAARIREANTIGQRFGEAGVQSVVLMDHFQKFQINYAYGALVAKAGTQARGAASPASQ